MNDPQPEGHHGKPRRTTKIPSHADRRRGSGVAAGGAGAAAPEDATYRLADRSKRPRWTGARHRLHAGAECPQLARGKQLTDRLRAGQAGISRFMSATRLNWLAYRP